MVEKPVWLFPDNNLLCGFADFLLRCVSGIAEGNEDGWFLVGGEGEQLAAQISVEVAYPAGGEALFRCCQTKVLHCNGDVDVAVMLAVRAHPLLVVEYGGYDIHGGGGEPLTVITLAQLLLVAVTADDVEAPRLFVTADGAKRTHSIT